MKAHEIRQRIFTILNAIHRDDRTGLEAHLWELAANGKPLTVIKGVVKTVEYADRTKAEQQIAELLGIW